MHPSRFRTLAFLVLLVAFLLRLGGACYWQASLEREGKHTRFGDSESYWVLASTIADGAPYQYASENSKIFRAPLYPLFLSPAVLIGKAFPAHPWLPYMVARLFGVVCGTLCVALIMRLAWELRTGEIPTLIAGTLAALYPGAIGMSLFLLSESLFCLLMLLSIACNWWALQSLSQQPASIDDEESAPLAPFRGEGLGGRGRSASNKNLVGNRVLHAPLPDPVEHLLPRRAGDAQQDRPSPEGRVSIGRGTSLWWILAGLFSGACCLARPSWSLWMAMLALYACGLLLWVGKTLKDEDSPLGLSRWEAFKHLAIRLACTALGIVLVMAPWWVRNYAITQKFVPTTLQVGPSLYDGLHPGATGSSDEGMDFVFRFWEEQTEEDEKRVASGLPLESTYEWRLNRRMQNAAIAWVLENPGEAFRLGWVKLGKTLRPFPVASEIGPGLVRIGEGVAYLVIVSLAILGLWGSRRKVGGWLFFLPFLYFPLLHMVFIGSVRYRQPAVLVLCILAGVGVCWLGRKRGTASQVP